MEEVALGKVKPFLVFVRTSKSGIEKILVIAEVVQARNE